MGYDNVIFPKDSMERRDLVLFKMHELGYINDAEYQKAKNEINDSINRYLAGVVNSAGRKLLYRGLYPGE